MNTAETNLQLAFEDCFSQHPGEKKKVNVVAVPNADPNGLFLTYKDPNRHWPKEWKTIYPLIKLNWQNS